MLPVGTKVYYTGDMANQDGHFEVIAHRIGNYPSYDVREINGDRVFKGIFKIAQKYNGTCIERFVTEEARSIYRNAAIEEMKRAALRRSYLAKEST